MPGPYAFPVDRVTGGPAPAADVNALGAAFNESASAPTPSVLALRDAAGRMQAEDPDAAADVATKGWVETQNGFLVPQSVVNAKGDLLVGMAADTVGRVGVGADGTVLTASSAAAEGVAWSPLPESAGINPAAYFQSGLPTGDNFLVSTEPGAGWANDGEWNSGENGQLVVMPFDSGRDGELNQLGVKINTLADGTGAWGVWASDANGKPTGLPLWSASVDVTTAGNKFSAISPGLDFPKGIRYWVGWLHLAWTVGSIKRQRVSAGTGDMFANLGAAFTNDSNGILMPVTNPSVFAQTRVLDNATTINTNLTGAALSRTGSRPHIIAKVTYA